MKRILNFKTENATGNDLTPLWYRVKVDYDEKAFDKSEKQKLLKNKGVKKAYDELGPEFMIIEKLIDKPIKQGMTQTQLAELVGTKQTAISRFESGTYNPFMSFLFKIVDALGTKLTVNVS